MDLEVLQQFGISASTLAILALLYRIFQYVKGKKVVSDCCGYNVEVGIDVRNMDSPVDGTANRTDSLGKQAERPKIKKSQIQVSPEAPN